MDPYSRVFQKLFVPLTFSTHSCQLVLQNIILICSYTFSITCALSVWVTVGVGVHTGGVTNITVLGTCTVSRRTWVELQVGTRDTGSKHGPVTILCGGGGENHVCHVCHVYVYTNMWGGEEQCVRV